MIEDKNTVVGSILESLDNLKNSKENKKDDYSGTKFGSSSVTNISLDYDEAIDEGLVDTSVEGIENFTRAKNERERIELEKTKDALKNIEEIKNSREQEKIDEVIQDLRKTDLEKIAKEVLNEVDYKTLKELKRGKEELLDNFPTNESSIKHKAKTITDKDRAWYEWEEVLGDYLTAGALNTVAMFTPTTSGLSKENADKLNDYNARIDVLQNKAIEEDQRRLHEIQEGLASDYLSAKKEAGRYSVPTGMNTYGTIVGKSDFLKHKAFLVNEQLIDDMNIKLNDGDFWSLNMGRKFNPHHFGLGISELVDDLTVYMPLLYKANKGEEELSDGEKSLMESLTRKSGYEQSGELSPNGYITKATTGFVDSFVFMSQMIFTRGLGAGTSIAKAILNQSVKQGIKKGVGKVAAQLGKSIVQTAAMPGTYSAIMDKYTGVIEKGVDEKGKDVFYMRESLYKKYKDDLMVWKKADVIKRKELLNLNSEGKLTKTQIKELEDLNYKLGHSAENPNFAMSYDEILSAVKPKSFLKSVGQGYAQNFNEVISELYGGKIIGKMLPKLKNPFFKSKIDQLSSNNKVSRLNNFANKSKPIRDLAGIGGIKEEYFEELFVAPLNAISEGSMQEIEMLLDPNYHLEILGQVAVTGGIMRAAGVPISALMNGRGNVSAKTLKEEAAKREAEAEAIGRLSIEDEERIEGLNELSDFIDLSANNSTIRTGDFNTRIRQLTNERKFDQADQLLGKLFDQLSFKAITTGTSVEYREQLDKLLKNEGGVELQPAFIAAIENSKKELTKLEKVREENIDHPELNKILEATQASMRADKVVKKADKTLQDNADNVRKAIDAKVKGTEFEGIIYDPTKILGGLDEIENEEESEKYKRFLSFIQEEADFRVTGSIVAESIKSAAFNTKSKVEELKNNTLSKEEETAQNKTYVQEYLKELQKLEVERIENNEENTDASFNAILNKVNGKLTNIPNDLKTKLGLKLKITRQKKIKDEQIKQQEAANKILAAEKALRDQEEGVQSLKDNRTQDEKDAENLIDAFSNTGNQPTGNRSLIVDADTDEALPVGDSSQADKNARKNSIFSLYNLFEKLNGRVPTFKEMVQKFYDKDRANAERVFLGIREAWEANEYKGVEYDKIYEEFFPDILELENTAFDAFNFTFGAEVKEPTREETNEKAEQEIKKIEEEASETESFDENGLPVKSIATNRTSSPATRLGFLALNYEEKIEDGIFKKLVKGGKLRISKVLNYFDLINPNKNNVGDRLGIEVSTEVDWDQIRVLNDSPNNPYSRNSKGKTLTIFFSDWLKKKEETWDSVRKDTDPVNFRDSQEFKNKVPMFTIGLEDGSRKAFIHETAWYNPFNVLVSYSQEVGAGNAGVDTENVTESQKDAIEEGKINHQNLRNRIIENEKTSPGTSQVEILEKHEGPFDVIPLSEPLIKVQESNPDSMIGLQLGTNTSLNISSSAMFTNQRNEDGSKRVIVNEEELKKDGHKTWMISHIDTIKDKDGTVTKRYRAFRTHNLNDEGKQGVKSESLNTVRFAYAVYAILNKGNSTMANAMYDSHVKDTEYDLTLEQAKEYAKKVLELTKVFNIEDFNSFTDFSRIYLNSKKDHADHLKRVREAKEDPKKKYDKRSAPYQAENLFNSNSTDFWANTAKEELDKTDRPVVKITKEGGVEKKSDNYVAYLKDILTVNVKSHNVGTNEDPVYATSLQPSIVYDLIAEKAPVPKVKEQAVKDAKEQVESLEKKIEETTKSVVTSTKENEESEIEAKKADIERRRQEEILNRKGNTIIQSEVERKFIDKRNSDNTQEKLTEGLWYTNGSVNPNKRWIDKDDAIFQELIDLGVEPDSRGVIDSTAINKSLSENESKIRKKVNEEIKQEGLKRVTDEFRKQDDKQKFKEINAKYDAELAALESNNVDNQSQVEDVNRRRQEELENRAKDIPVKYEQFKDINGNDITKVTYKDGSSDAFFTDSGTEASKDGNLEGLIEANQNPYKTETAKERGKGKLENKINAKYDAELAALDSKESTTEIVKKAEETVNDLNAWLEGQGFSVTTEDDLFTDQDIINMSDTSQMKDMFKTVEGLTYDQETGVVDYIYRLFLQDVILKTTGSFQSLKNNKKNDVIAVMDSKKEIITKYLKTLKEVDAKLKAEGKQPNTKITVGILNLTKSLVTINSIGNNWEVLADKALAILEKKHDTKNREDEDNKIDDTLYIKDNNKTSFEEISKLKASKELRRMFENIKQLDSDGNVVTGFLGFEKRMNSDDVYNTLAQILMSGFGVTSNYKDVKDKLKTHQETSPWITELLKELDGGSQQLRNQFIYNIVRHGMTMKFGMVSNDQDGLNYKVFDTNANEIKKIILNNWAINFRSSKLLDSENKIDKNKAKNLLLKLENLGEDLSKVDLELVKDWISNFGIELSDGVWKDLKNNKVTNNSRPMPFNSFLHEKNGLILNLKKYLEYIQNVEDTHIEADKFNHPFSDISGVLKVLANAEAKHHMAFISTSFRDNKKNISGLIAPSYSTDRVSELKRAMLQRLKIDDISGMTTSDIINHLRNTSFSKHSIILDALEKDLTFAGKFGVSHVGLTALKELGKKASEFAGVTDLNSLDYDVLALIGFQDTQQETVEFDDDVTGITKRVARMFLPTMSDKSQMLQLTGIAYNFFKDFKKSFSGEIEDKEYKLSAQVRELLYKQIILPELTRIVDYTSKGIGNKVNIKDYDKGARRFNLLPSLNNVVGKENDIAIRNYFGGISTEDINLKEVERIYKESLTDALEKNIHNQVGKQMEEWKGSVAVYNDQGKVVSLKFDSKYLKQLDGDLDSKFKAATYDFIMNNMLSYNEMFKVLAGDPAQYSKDAAFKIGDETYDPSELDATLEDVVSKRVGVNIGKRLALLIAPGLRIANAHGEKYQQIFLDDQVGMAENMEYMITARYGAKVYNKLQKKLVALGNAKGLKRKLILLEIKATKSIPLLMPFLDIESTDAQEYTTLDEHIHILINQGRLDDEKVEQVQKLLALQRKLKNPQYYLSKEEVDLVLQPIKPVYTGQSYEPENGLMRTIYIKSSSFPLIPQLTKGTNLDPLRVKMESLGSHVRASYQSANKVGAVKTPIDPFSKKGLDSIKLGVNMLILDRANFRIQQDIPTKNSNIVSMGTQIFKMLLGNDVLSKAKFIFKGENITGKQLYNKYNDTFAALLKNKRYELYKELGLDDQGGIRDKKFTVSKISELLKKEATKRGYSDSDLSSLEIVKIDMGDKSEYEFKIPIWLHPNGNKYESLLNSIISNRMMTIKMPGYSSVVGSESGFEYAERDKNGKIKGVDESRIIYLDGWNGKELQGVKTVKENGETTIQSAQVFVSSHFRDHTGKLIDLFKKDKNNNYIYLIKNKEGGLGLNTEMFDKELLESFTFRTPTSSHVSGSVVQIVGILPPESGDLMIVPKSFTKQKGLDFDVDKETTYQLNHTIDNDGRIRVLDQAYIDAKRDRLDSFIDKNMKVELDLIERQKGEIEMLLKDQGFSELEISMLQEETLNYKIKLETRKGREEIRDSLIHKLEGQLLENDFVRVHISIYKNPNKDIQNKINSVLSMEFAGEQADMIEKLEEFSNESSYNDFTILSHAYQKIKMTLGAVGKMAIGVYSNSVTFHAAATIAAQTGNPISLQQKVEDGSYEPMSFTLGNVTSDGVFGRIKALAGKVGDAVRDVSDVFGEKQNTATDNEKEQILGRVGINKHTIGVDSLLTELGFDKDKNGNSIPYFFLSQPIIKEYSKLMDDAFGITAKYNKNAEKDIIKQLAEKYGAEYNEEYVVDQSVFSPEAMLNGIQDKSDKSIQFDALMQFLEYKGIADNLAKKQSVLNTNNLGKSIIESNNTFDNLVDFKEAQFKNLEKTIGTFNRFKSYEAAMADDPSYVKVKDDLYIRPETPQGNIVVHGLTLAKNLWSDYFPYGDQAFEKLYKEFGKLDGEISEFKKITLKETIVKEFKKYIYSRKNNGLFSESSIIERSRLFINTKTNQAISNYLSEVTRKNTGEFKDGLKLLQSNALLNKFTYDINVDGTASTIKYNNTANDSFDEGPVEKALAQLIVENKKLPPKNGRPYNTKMLAQELINYAYLEGGVQEAVQFVTFIPVQYLDSLSINGVSVSENLRMIGSPSRVGNGSKGFEKVIGFTPDQDVSMFFRQFIQHFPEEATQFSESDLKKHIPAFKWANGRPTPTFSIENHPDGGPKFISIRNTKSRSKLKQDKWVLYERTHGEGSVNYVRRDTLGVHGMSEYQYMTLNAKTVLKGKSAYVETFIPLINVEFTPNEKKQYFGFNNDAKVADILDNIINSKIEGGEYLIIVAKLLKPFLNTETKVKVLDDIKDYRGFMRKKNTIVMSADFLQNNSPKEIANAFLHEYIHSVTSNEIEKYVSRNEETGTYNVKENAPESVFKLIKAFNQFSNTIPQSEKDALTDKLRRRGEGENVGAFNDREFVVYAATNIQEFMSASLTSETFMSHASKITIKDKKLSDIIKAIYQEFLVSLAGLVGNEATLASESIGLTLDFIREEGKKRIKEIDAHTLYNESDLSNETTKLPKPVNKSSTLTDEQKLNESLLEDDNKPATDQSLGTNDIENFIKTLKKKDCE